MTAPTETPGLSLINYLTKSLLDVGFVQTIPGQFCKPDSHERVRTNYVHGEWTVTVRDSNRESARFRIRPDSSHLPPALNFALVGLGVLEPSS